MKCVAVQAQQRTRFACIAPAAGVHAPVELRRSTAGESGARRELRRPCSASWLQLITQGSRGATAVMPAVRCHLSTTIHARTPDNQAVSTLTPRARAAGVRAPARAAAAESMAAVTAPALTLTALPPALVLHVFSLLPADARARAACVCRGWRTTLLERSLWTRLDLSPSSGVAVRVTDAVLAGAAGKSRGQLAALDVSGCVYVTFDALLAVVHANSGALWELCVGAREYGTWQTLDADHVERLLRAAPQLTACDADVLGESSAVNTRRMLRNEAPFQPLRLHTLRITFDDADEASVLSLAADFAAHASLRRVVLSNAPLGALAALDAVVNAALACQLASLCFWFCRLSPASAPALVRLLGGGALKALEINQFEQLLDGPSAALLGDALRANATLTSLNFHAELWRDADVAAALLGALTGHRSVRTLKLSSNHVLEVQCAAAGAALGALVAANAPALQKLDVSMCNLGDAGLRPLFEALPANTHLRTLNVSYNNMSAAFARDVLLPAVRANTSLRTLHAATHFFAEPLALKLLNEAEALVRARADAAA
jgi:hypothetical protein